MTYLSCGCRVLDGEFLRACPEHLCEFRYGRHNEAMWVGGTFVMKRCTDTHPGLVAALAREGTLAMEAAA